MAISRELAGEKEMTIRGPFHHVHLLSEDPEVTTQWYVRNLDGHVFDGAHVRGSMRFRVRLGEAQLNIRGPRPGETLVTRPQGKTVGIDHFGLATDEIEVLMRKLEENGVRIVEPIFTTPGGGRAFFIEAPDGVVIEIMESK